MKRFKVINNSMMFNFGLKIGDIVTLVEGSDDNDLYELPPRLHGEGHNGEIFNQHLNLKENNYIYIKISNLKEIKLIRLDITYFNTKLTTRFLVESIKVVDDVLSFTQKGLTHRYHLENYTFTINGNEYFS